MAMVATAEAPVAAPKAFMRAVRRLLAKSDGEPLIAEADQKVNAGYVVTVSGVSIAVVPMPFAIPAGTLGTAIGNEYVWKDAGDTFIRSKGHFLISVVSPDIDASQRFNQARLLTAVTAAVLSTSKGLGVFWQSADSVISPARFLTQSKTVGADKTASELWFSLRFFPGSSDPNSDFLVCQSTGLAAFLGREIECGPYAMTPAEIADTVILVARYMATAGPVFGDGHTLGIAGTKEPDARIFFDWSTLGGMNKPIIQLRLMAQERVMQ